MSVNNNMAKLLYVITQGPYSSAQGQEALDAILIGASFEQNISVLFLHDGVFQLKMSQNKDGKSDIKIFTKTYKALNDFGVDQIFVHDLSMLSRGLTSQDLMMKTQQLSSPEVAELFSQQTRVFTF